MTDCSLTDTDVSKKCTASVFRIEEQEEVNAAWVAYSSAVMMESVHFSKISVNVYQTRRYHISENSSLHTHARVNLIPHKSGLPE